MNLTAEQRIQKASARILECERYRALSGVFMMGTKTVSDSVPTAYTDGLNEVYGRSFVDNLNDAELRYVMLHECKHKMYQHLSTWAWMFKEDSSRANRACDHVINLELNNENSDGFAVMPSKFPGCANPEFAGLSAGEIYHKLEGDDSNKDQGFDEHDWEQAQSLTEEEQKELTRAVDQALRQGLLAAQKSGSASSLNIGDLLEPQIRWQDALREFITSTCTGSDYSTWRRPNRRYVSSGLYLPSGVSETMDELAILVDSSGSVMHFMHGFLSEVDSILKVVKPRRTHLIYWDTEVESHEIFEQGVSVDLTNSKAVGGGGTSIECVHPYMRKHNIKPTACVVLTDGFISGRTDGWVTPVLWCILDNKRFSSQSGKVLHINARL